MKRHPEQLDGELWIGNVEAMQFHKSAWLSKRMGITPRDVNGDPIEPRLGDYRPWFIRASEIEQAIATEEALQRPWSAEKITVYRKMLEEHS